MVNRKNVNEFESQVKSLVSKVKELRFLDTAGFKPFSKYFCSESVMHPAKANLFLLYYLIKRYTKEGDTVLDPMAGTGSTGIIASLLGRDAILVEYEKKFCDWIEKNIKLIEQYERKKGEIIVTQGDSRFLSKILKEKLDPKNIESLKYGSIDSILTSPPYEGSLEGTTRHTRGGIASRDPRLAQSGTFATVMSFGVPIGYSPDPNQIGNLKSSEEEYKKLEIDETIERLRKYGRTDPKAGGPYGKSLAHPYSSDPKQIGNLKSGEKEYKKLEIDAVLTSPPYEASYEFAEHHTKPEDKAFKLSKEKRLVLFYSSDSKQIGNLRGETYLEAMFKVYSECYKVLKPGGRMILIIKPFIRNKKVIDLPYHTYLLCKQIRFELEEVLKFRLPGQSFWRILYHEKYSEVPRIAHEYILIFRKFG